LGGEIALANLEKRHACLQKNKETSMAQERFTLVMQLCVEPPTVTKMLQRMEKAGLVERRLDNQEET
jgi:DNA-binding MarR family transcriptional regulator